MFCNCGPLTSLVLGIRAKNGLNLPLIREIHTLGWVGTFFQEFVANDLSQSNDLVIHASSYSASVWKQIAPQHQSIVYQPIIRSEYSRSGKTQKQRQFLQACFLSRLSRDKGFHEIPRLVKKLKEEGWPISKVDIAGREIDVNVSDARKLLRNIGVKLVYHGQLTRLETLQIIQKSDLVLFPSTSSFEALGRVVVEAIFYDKIVFGSDYCGTYDLFPFEYRIPLQKSLRTGNSFNAFSIADLDIHAWKPPQYTEATLKRTNNNALSAYKYNSKTFSQIFELTLNDVRLSRTFEPVNVEMKVDFDSYKHHSAEYWVFAMITELKKINPSRQDLNDLGGVFKKCLKDIGFTPDVSFTTVKD